MPTGRLLTVLRRAAAAGAGPTVRVGRVVRRGADGRLEVQVGSETVVAGAATDEPVRAGQRVYLAPLGARPGRGGVVLGRAG